MLVSEVMHRGVSTVQINDSLKKVAALMKREDVGGVPVYKNERPVGFVTDRDIVISCVAQGHSPEEPISHAMRPDLISVHENDDLDQAVSIMEQNQISRILVVDKGERPVGMLSLHDIALNERETMKSEALSEIKKH